jgi:predicted small secreted protein
MVQLAQRVLALVLVLTDVKAVCCVNTVRGLGRCRGCLLQQNARDKQHTLQAASSSKQLISMKAKQKPM